MTGPEIAVALVSLVQQGVIRTFYRSSCGELTRWVIVPNSGPPSSYTRDGVVDYLELARELAAA